MITSLVLKEKRATKCRRLNNSFVDHLHCSDRKSWERRASCKVQLRYRMKNSFPSKPLQSCCLCLGAGSGLVPGCVLKLLLK